MGSDTLDIPAGTGGPDAAPGPDASAAERGPARAWTRSLGALTYLAETLIVVAILGEMAATIAGIISRHFFEEPLAWTDDLATICLSLITFLGGPIAIHRGRGMSLELLVNRLGLRWAQAVKAAGMWTVIVYAIRLLMTAPQFVSNAQANRTPNLSLPTSLSAIWIPVGCVLLVAFMTDQLLCLPWRRVAEGAVAAAVGVGTVALVAHLDYVGILAVPPLAGLLVVFAVTLLCGVPIAIVIGIAALAYIQIDNTIPLATAPVALQGGTASFVFLAVPFFMLAGVLMDVGGLAIRLTNVIVPIVRRLPGGMLITQVLTVYIFSGISGSKTADIAAVGSVMRRPLADAGYEPAESTAVLAASAAMSETIPPSLAIIVLASITTLSPGSLFLAGILPATAMAAVLTLGILWRSRAGRYPRSERASVAEAARALPAAIPALVLPVILVYGIVAGIGTSTEVSAVAALYGIVVVMIGYRSLRLAQVWRAAVDASVLGGLTLFIIANAAVLSQALTIDRVPEQIADALNSVGGRAPFMILSLVILVVLGALLEGLPSIVVFAPLFLPIAQGLGINPLQYGIALLIAMGIGSFAPPIGAGLYVAAVIGETTVEKVMRPAFMYTAILLVGLAVVASVPAITLVLQ